MVDFKLRAIAKALQSWSMRNVGSVRLQLFMAREIIAQLDAAQDTRLLTDEELSLRKELKMHTLGLASLARTIARQRSRIRFLEEETRTQGSSTFRLATGTGKTKYLPFSTTAPGSWQMWPSLISSMSTTTVFWASRSSGST